jgi:hypothetical protein
VKKKLNAKRPAPSATARAPSPEAHDDPPLNAVLVTQFDEYF